MGILRADRLSGLGGANAINGSVHFQGGDGNNDTAWIKYIDAGVSEDYNFGTGDFTVECWLNRKGTTNDDTIWGSTLAEASTSFMWFFNSYGNLRAVIDGESGASRSSTSNSISVGTWYHVAITRASGTMQMWVDGVSKYSATASGNIGSSTQNFIIGNSNTSYSGTNYHFLGHISNLRIQKGKAEYTEAFTPPTTRLSVTPETVLLACHDSGNVLAEATGKTLNLVKSGNTVGNNSAGIIASRFVPDVGEDYGTTFATDTRFNTLTYMVPPGGTTTQSNRGRGVFGGGYTSVPGDAPVKRIYYIQIDSMGTSAEFGDTNKAAAWGQGGCSSSTRGLFTGGTTPTNLNDIDYITIATTSNALDFGDLNVTHGYTASCSNNTRGLTGGGRGNSPTQRLAQIDYNTIATLGNGQDFGDLTQSRMGLGAVASSTRGVFTGGNGSPADPSTVYNVIDYVEFATLGDATDFGDMLGGHTYHGSCSSSTRGIIYGGVRSYGPTLTINVIEYITIASTGSGTNFGDVRDDGAHAHGTSNSIRGVFAGGVNPYRNSIDFITITTLGDGVEWGDLPIASGSYAYAAGLSDSHGGISS